MRVRKRVAKGSDKELNPFGIGKVVSTSSEPKKPTGYSEEEYRDLIQQWKIAKKRRIELARNDINEFCAYVGRDAETGKRIEQEEIHCDFQDAADTHNRLIVMSHPESGKSTQLGILRLIYLLGRNPNLRIGISSWVDKKTVELTRSIKSYIEKSKEVAEVFPELVPGDTWREDYFIVRRSVHSRDASVQALSFEAAPPTGSRFDVLVLDDILNGENTNSEANRDKTLKRIRKNFIDRLSSDGVVIFLTNAWHPKDAAHVLASEGWHMIKVPIYDENKKITWPGKWTPERLAQMKKDLGPIEFARAFLCKARDEGESPFNEKDVERAKELAKDLTLVYEVTRSELPQGARAIVGVDLAVTKKKTSHLTCLTTILFWPHDFSRQLLWVHSGKWGSTEIRDQIIDHYWRYDSPLFIVENNGAQRWIIDIVMNHQLDIPLENRCLPEIVPFRTGTQKAHPEFGVEGLSVEVHNDKWLFPTDGPDPVVKEVNELMSEMLYYVRGSHTGDRLMSLWFAREGARRGIKAGTSEKSRVRSPEPSQFSDVDDQVHVFG